MKSIIILVLIMILLSPFAYSNGGCVKIAAKDVFVQLSMAPLAPKVGEQASMLISFGDYNGLLNGTIKGNITIVRGGQNVIFTKYFETKDGILDMKHTFTEPGYYEVYFDFSYKNKRYAPEDFAIQVSSKQNGIMNNVIFLIFGLFIGVSISRLLREL